MSDQLEALKTRWNGFLPKVKQRHLDVLEQSKQPLAEIIDSLEFDSIVIHNILQGIKNESVYQLVKKLDEAWDKMDNEFDSFGLNYDLIAPMRKQKDDLYEFMNDNYERFNIKAFADAARKIEQNILKVVDPEKIHNCVQCGSQLNVEVFAFQSINVKCDNCGSINTYEPDGRVRQLEGVYSALADEFAMEERIMKDKSNKYGAPYLKKYYGFIIDKLPQRKEYYERILNDKLNNPDFVGS